MVANGSVLIFDPIEIVTLVDRAMGHLVFCGTSTAWRPDRSVLEELRAIGRCVGEAMADTCGFRGGFSVDGIMSASGFLATEVNARSASGSGLRRAWPEFPLYIFERLLVESPKEFHEVDVEGLEDVARRRIAAEPSISVLVPRDHNAPSKGMVKLMDGKAAGNINFAPSLGGTRSRMLSLVSERKDGVVGGFAASLAHHLGKQTLQSPIS
jgi:hypothetical protein